MNYNTLTGKFQKIDFNAVDSDPVRLPEGFNPGDPGYNPASDPILIEPATFNPFKSAYS